MLIEHLQALAPQFQAQAHGGWWPLLQRWHNSPAFRALDRSLAERTAAGAVIYPSQPLYALLLTPPTAVKVVVLGQDPYHGKGQAEGLAFSVASGVSWPPSLRNIFKEMSRDLQLPMPRARGGSLTSWSLQGVLLLNSALTVEDGRPGSHAKLGWRSLTDAIVKVMWVDDRPKVFMLWGSHAQAQGQDVGVVADADSPHRVLCSNHPSPLSARRPPAPFIGNGHFGSANRFLLDHGQSPIDWKLP